jgi:hypothetical protein
MTSVPRDGQLLRGDVRVQGINGIMAVMGHRSARMAHYYTQEAKKSTLTDAAMTAWEQADKRAEAA